MIKTCLFPAAGYGTRFLPMTKAIPKEMLPILTKPLIQYGVEEALEAGIKNMAFVTGRGKRALEDHFDISYELEHQIKGTDKEKYILDIRELIHQCTFSYTRQHHMKGLGHAILCGEHLIKENAFAVLLADDLCHNSPNAVLTQMVQKYMEYQCTIIAVMEVDPSDVNKYGIINGEPISKDCLKVTEMVEKPSTNNAPSNLAIIGRYILTKDIFDKIRSTQPGINGEIQITDALLSQAEEGKVIAYKFKGQRYDCGSLEGYVEATNSFYRKMKKQ